MDREEFITRVYCVVDDFFRALTAGKQVRRRGPQPNLTDAEVITMQVVGEFLGMDGDKNIWAYFSCNWRSLFPAIGDRTTFVKQLGNLWYWVERMQQEISRNLGGFSDNTHITDGFPVPVCNFKRAYFAKTFKTSAAYGYCAAKGSTYYGFKGHLVINREGVVSNFCFAAANIDERDVVIENVDGITGRLLGDKGLSRLQLSKDLDAKGIRLEHPLRLNMKEIRSDEEINKLKNQRRLVETVIGQLTERFNIEKVRARNIFRLGIRFTRKILAHTIAIFINIQMGRPALRFEGIVG